MEKTIIFKYTPNDLKWMISDQRKLIRELEHELGCTRTLSEIEYCKHGIENAYRLIKRYEKWLEMDIEDYFVICGSLYKIKIEKVKQ